VRLPTKPTQVDKDLPATPNRLASLELASAQPLHSAVIPKDRDQVRTFKFDLQLQGAANSA
jgi:hypothetical protein